MLTKIVKITKGTDFSFDLHLQDDDGLAINITNFTQVRFKMDNSAGGKMELTFPLKAVADEVQTLDMDAVPDAGSYKIKIGSETTVIINNGASSTDVQNAINALTSFSTVVVTGSEAAGFIITFQGDDGQRNQPEIEIIDNTLTNSTVAVVITIVTTQQGVGQNGIDVINAGGGHIRVVGNEEDSGSLDDGCGQDADLIVKINGKDLNIPKLQEFVDVDPGDT